MTADRHATRERLSDIDLAKGVAIFLVVLGHVVAREPPVGNEWYVGLKFAVYQFHMPFFMFLSGAVFRATRPAAAGLRGYGPFVLGRLRRLAPGFALFALLIWAGKAVASRVIHVDNPQSADLASLARIFTHPGASAATSLWYVYVLLELSLLFPLLLAAFRGRALPVLVVAAALHALPLGFALPELFALDLLCEHALWFALGLLAIDHRRACVGAVAANALPFYLGFGLSFLALLWLPDHAAKTIIGLASLPAVYAFANSFAAVRDRRGLLLLGEYTFTVYLMNTLAIGLAKGVLLEVLPWDHANFALYFPLLLAAGLLGPIALHRAVLSRQPLLARITK